MKPQTPILSVVTVVFNDCEALQETCLSIREQRASSMEHVVIDGGSSDGSQDLLQSYVPDVFVSEPDSGIYDAMNKGARLSSGRYVSFLNAGDKYARPTVLADAEAALAVTRARWAYGRARIVDASGHDVRRPVGRERYSPALHRYGLATICHQAVWMERSYLFELGGFSEEFGLAGDYHLLVKAGADSTPTTWRGIDILYLAGGASDINVYPQLVRRHLARVDVLDSGWLAKRLDALWTRGQIAYVALRKAFKQVVARHRSGGNGTHPYTAHTPPYMAQIRRRRSQ